MWPVNCYRSHLSCVECCVLCHSRDPTLGILPSTIRQTGGHWNSTRNTHFKWRKFKEWICFAVYCLCVPRIMEQSDTRTFALELRKFFLKDSQYQNCNGEFLGGMHPASKRQEEQLTLCSVSLVSLHETDFLASAKINHKRYLILHMFSFSSITWCVWIFLGGHKGASHVNGSNAYFAVAVREVNSCKH